MKVQLLTSGLVALVACGPSYSPPRVAFESPAPRAAYSEADPLPIEVDIWDAEDGFDALTLDWALTEQRYSDTGFAAPSPQPVQLHPQRLLDLGSSTSGDVYLFEACPPRHGEFILTLTVTDSDGESATAERAFYVEQAPSVLTVTAPQDQAELPLGPVTMSAWVESPQCAWGPQDHRLEVRLDRDNDGVPESDEVACEAEVAANGQAACSAVLQSGAQLVEFTLVDPDGDTVQERRFVHVDTPN